MLELEDAVQNILSAVKPLSPETVSINEAHGRYAAEPIVSAIDLPGFDNSAMDGYAVRSGDLQTAGEDAPVPLHLVGSIPAGAMPNEVVQPGCCIRIFTGSPLPPGADAVVMQEDTRIDSGEPSTIWVNDTVKPWENVRFRGEDIRSGSTIVEPGGRLSAGICSLVAAVGLAHVKVFRRPVVGLLATGSELVEPGVPLKPGEIYESNRTGLSGMIQACGAIPKSYPLVADNLDATKRAMQTAFDECDAVITSGGVSVGEFDFVKTAFTDLGGELAFWKVAIKPGKPFVFGQLENKFLFGLPGNPVSALVTFFLLARPALLRLQGAACVAPVSHPGTLARAIRNPGARRHFVRVHVDAEGNVMPTGIQASHILSSLIQADGLVDVPPKADWQPGRHVQVIRWD